MLHKPLLWIALAASLAVAALGIAGHERTLSRGQRVFLELAPVDPRSLMQGDYMALRFAIAAPIAAARSERAGRSPEGRLPRDGMALVRPDARGIVHFEALGHAPAGGQLLLRFQTNDTRLRDDGVQISTDAWFFEEGQAERFSHARYGEFALAPDGTALLVGLRDEQLNPL